MDVRKAYKKFHKSHPEVRVNVCVDQNENYLFFGSRDINPTWYSVNKNTGEIAKCNPMIDEGFLQALSSNQIKLGEFL